MYWIQNICSYLKEWLSIIKQFLSLKFVSSDAKDLEIIALRSQLALFVKDIDAGKRNKPRPTPVFRQLWLRQQFRNATPFGNTPKYLVHDNDPAFKSKVFQDFLVKSNIKSKPTSYRSPWQNPYAERVIGTIRRNYLIMLFLSTRDI